MEETNAKEPKAKKRLSPLSTVLITVTATLGAIVLARVIYFIFTGA